MIRSKSIALPLTLLAFCISGNVRAEVPSAPDMPHVLALANELIDALTQMQRVVPADAIAINSHEDLAASVGIQPGPKKAVAITRSASDGRPRAEDEVVVLGRVQMQISSMRLRALSFRNTCTGNMNSPARTAGQWRNLQGAYATTLDNIAKYSHHPAQGFERVGRIMTSIERFYSPAAPGHSTGGAQGNPAQGQDHHNNLPGAGSSSSGHDDHGANQGGGMEDHHDGDWHHGYDFDHYPPNPGAIRDGESLIRAAQRLETQGDQLYLAARNAMATRTDEMREGLDKFKRIEEKTDELLDHARKSGVDAQTWALFSQTQDRLMNAGKFLRAFDRNVEREYRLLGSMLDAMDADMYSLTHVAHAPAHGAGHAAAASGGSQGAAQGAGGNGGHPVKTGSWSFNDGGQSTRSR